MSFCVLEPQRSSVFALGVPYQPMADLDCSLLATFFVSDTNFCSFAIGEQWQVNGAG